MRMGEIVSLMYFIYYSFFKYPAFRQLFVNFITERAFDDLFARAGRQFLLGRWCSESLFHGDADMLRHYAAQADMPQRVLAADKKPPALSPYNTNRLRLQVRLCLLTLLWCFREFNRWPTPTHPPPCPAAASRATTWAT